METTVTWKTGALALAVLAAYFGWRLYGGHRDRGSVAGAPAGAGKPKDAAGALALAQIMTGSKALADGAKQVMLGPVAADMRAAQKAVVKG
jgi:hypothetical protein